MCFNIFILSLSRVWVGLVCEALDVGRSDAPQGNCARPTRAYPRPPQVCSPHYRVTGALGGGASLLIL